MSKDEHEVIKRILENKDLADETEKVRPGIKAQMAGYLMSPWLPHGTTRKIIMVVIVLIALVGVVYSCKLFILLLLILPFFSPRIVGEIARFIGMISKK
jgi:hypothetical protein